jgi:hypothetical protein
MVLDPAHRVWLPAMARVCFDNDVNQHEPENQMTLAPLWMESVAPAGCRVRQSMKAVNHGG